MSFSGVGDFVSLGYPWVLPGYEGELQERLYDEVYGFAAGPHHGGKTFAQRFRQQWAAQISFFKRHGFTEQRHDPFFVLDLRAANAPTNSGTADSLLHDLPESAPPTPCYSVEIQPQFEWRQFQKLVSADLPKGHLAIFDLYFQTVDFDFAVKATKGSCLTAYMGFTIRSDTGFAELITGAVDHAARDVFQPCLLAAVHELQSRGALFLGTKSTPSAGASEAISQMGFQKVSEDLMLVKQI
jgi:hypothetical protein